MAQIYYVTPEEIARRKKRIITPPDMAEIALVQAERAEWLRVHGNDKPAPPLWENLKIPKLRVIDIWDRPEDE